MNIFHRIDGWIVCACFVVVCRIPRCGRSDPCGPFATVNIKQNKSYLTNKIMFHVCVKYKCEQKIFFC